MTAVPVLDFDADAAFDTFKLAAQFTAGDGVTALFGPSGSGKTTIINLIAGLYRPDRGKISLSGLPLVDTEMAIFVPKHKRRMGLVYQDAQLFPHLTVEQNLHFGRWFAPRRADGISADAVIETLGIAGLLHRRPARLSGGEKQRVALARALLSAPKLLLMDEPLAGLDEDRKQDIMQLIERTRDEFRVPIIYVSHALDEVRRLASEVVVLRDGRVTACGTPAEVLKV
jgi:molybdate transport system ATP-binding protein